MLSEAECVKREDRPTYSFPRIVIKLESIDTMYVYVRVCVYVKWVAEQCAQSIASIVDYYVLSWYYPAAYETRIVIQRWYRPLVVQNIRSAFSSFFCIKKKKKINFSK